MLHGSQKVLESPVIRNGFKPMEGHDEAKKGQETRGERVSEHGEVQMKREREEGSASIEVAAH